MDSILLKFLNKHWWVGEKPHTALFMLHQLAQDIRTYIKKQTDEELANINFFPNFKLCRSVSCPEFRVMFSL
jgi:hypothetical protein